MNPSKSKSSKPATVRYVEFVRVSTKGQADKDTPEMQIQALERLQQQRGGTLVERIMEKHISGTLPQSQRPDLQRLAVLAGARAFDELRIYAIDRLTRSPSPEERMAVLSMVSTAGAVIVDVNGHVMDRQDDSGFGELEYFFQSWMASREAKRIKDRTQGGMKRVAHLGQPINGGRPPFGYSYDKATRTWSLHPEHADWVRRIFEECAAGATCDSIANLLRANGVPSSRNGTWHYTSIARLIKKRAYIGEYSQNIGGLEYPFPVPAIVDESLFRRANEALAARSNRPKVVANVEALCRGRLLCGRCGQRMQVRRSTRGGKSYTYYQCGSKHPHTKAPNCKGQNHPVAALDAVVWVAIKQKLNDPKLLRDAAKPQSGPGKPWEDQLAEAKYKLKKLKMDEKGVLRLLMDGLAEQACREQLADLAVQRASWEKQVEQANQGIALREALRLDLTNLLDRINTIQAGLEDADFETQRELVVRVVPELPGFGITVHDDGRMDIVGALGLPDSDGDDGPWGQNGHDSGSSSSPKTMHSATAGR